MDPFKGPVHIVLEAIHLVAGVGHALKVHFLPYWAEHYVLPVVVLILTISFVRSYFEGFLVRTERAFAMGATVCNTMAGAMRYLRLQRCKIKRQLNRWFAKVRRIWHYLTGR